MAYASIEETLTQGFSSGSTTHAVDMPNSVSSGELLLIVFSSYACGTITTPSGWTSLDTKGNHGAVFAKDADGTEGGTSVTVTVQVSKTASAIVHRISGWGGTLADDVDIAAVSAAQSAYPNARSLTAGWGAADNLFLSVAVAGDDDASFDSAPSGYSGLTSIVSGGGTNNGCSAGSAYIESASDTEDPTAFTLSASESWYAWTLVIEPGAAVGVSLVQLERRMPRGFCRGFCRGAA
jgi:hypothetical protein